MKREETKWIREIEGPTIDRVDLKEITEDDVKKYAIETLKYKEITTYIVKSIYHDLLELNQATFYKNKQLNYIANPAYVINCYSLEAYIEYLKNQQQIKYYNLEDLENIKDYVDYRNKRDFMANIYYQLIDGVSVFNDDYSKEKYPFKHIIWCFKNENNLKEFMKFYNRLEAVFESRMKDKDFFKSAVKYEMFNHETPINWDGWDPALNSLGIKYNLLNDDFKMLVNEAYKECCREIEW